MMAAKVKGSARRRESKAKNVSEKAQEKNKDAGRQGKQKIEGLIQRATPLTSKFSRRQKQEGKPVKEKTGRTSQGWRACVSRRGGTPGARRAGTRGSRRDREVSLEVSQGREQGREVRSGGLAEDDSGALRGGDGSWMTLEFGRKRTFNQDL